MHEQGPGNDPQQQLIELLSAEFGPHGTEDVESATVAVDDSTPEVQARLASPENEELGHQAAQLVAPAPITDSFKSYIASEVRWAHARRSTVGLAVSPDKLGLTSGQGIFDTEQAQAIERRTLRYYVAATIRQHVRIPLDEAGREHSPLIPDPEGYRAASAACDAWLEDYAARYGEPAVEDEERERGAFWRAIAETVQLGEHPSDDLPSLPEVLDLERQARRRRSGSQRPTWWKRRR